MGQVIVPSVLVANRHNYVGDPAHAIYIGRPSQWGNPWSVAKFGRGEAIRLFRLWWYSPLNGPMREHALFVLPGKTLLCYCKPRDCHGDVIAEYVNTWERDRVLLVA